MDAIRQTMDMASRKVKVKILPFSGLDEKQKIVLSLLKIARTEESEFFQSWEEWLENCDDHMLEWLERDEKHIREFVDSPLDSFRKAAGASDRDIEKLQQFASLYKDMFPDFKHKEALTTFKAPLRASSQYIDYAQGWDAVSAICQKEANAAISYAYNKGVLPTNFEFDTSVKVLGIPATVSVKGKFGTFQITGGQGTCIDIVLPIKEGEGSVKIIGQTTAQGSLAGMTIGLSTDLNCIETKRQDGQGNHCEFYINLTSPETFSKVSLGNLPPELAEVSNIVESALLSALNKAADNKEYKLFEADINTLETKPYLVPTRVRYAFVESSKGTDDNIIGALVQTDGEGGNSLQILDGTIPGQSRTALVVSNRLFVDKILRDILVNSLGCDTNILATKNDPRVLYNTESFDYKDEIEGYRPTIESLEVRIANDLLYMNFIAKIVPSKGITVTYTVQSSFKAIITEKKENNQTVQYISFKENTYEESHEVNASWWAWLIGYLSFGIGAAILGIILAIIDACCPNIGSSTITTSIGNIKWNYLNVIRLKEIYLQGTVQIGGSITLLE